MRRLLDSIDDNKIVLNKIPLGNCTWRCGYIESIDDFFVYVCLDDQEEYYKCIELDVNPLKGRNFVRILKNFISDLSLKVYLKNNTRISGYEICDFDGLIFYSKSTVILNIDNVHNLNLKAKIINFQKITEIFIVENSNLQSELMIFNNYSVLGSKNSNLILCCENFQIQLISKIFYSQYFSGIVKTYFDNISKNYSIGDSLKNIHDKLFKNIQSDIYMIFNTNSLECYVIIKKDYLTTSQKDKYKLYNIKEGYVIFSRSLKRMSYKKWINDFVRRYLGSDFKVF